MISGRTRTIALIGHPVLHSLSPVMQNAALDYMGTDIRYLAYDVRPEDIAQAVRSLICLGMAGANVTVPHKEAVIGEMDDISVTAAAVGAVNTIVVAGDKLTGHNTDVGGLLRALRFDAGRKISGERYLVLGAGGAARAAVYALLIDGAEAVYVANRTVSRAEELCNDFAGPARGRLKSLSILDVKELRGGVDVMINATSAGLHPNDEQSPLDASGYDIICGGMLLLDMVYNPSPTRLMREAAARGASVLDGVGMLVHQGAESLRLWLDREPPVKVMRQAIAAFLGRDRLQQIK